MDINRSNTEKVWLDYQSNLKAFLKSRVKTPEDVEDILQDIMLKVHKNLPTLKSNAKLKPWLFQIARNTIIDFYRARQKSNNINAEDITWCSDKENVEHALERCVVPFINSLPEKYRPILQAIDLEGQSQKDYANDHDLCYSTLKSRVQKGRELLKTNFEECCDLSFDRRGRLLDVHPKEKDYLDC